MLKGWSKFEKIWLMIFISIILSVTIIFSWSGTDYSSIFSIILNWVVSPLSAITGLVCVVLAARGSMWNYIWGVINCITYGFIAYHSGYYGDMIINIFYFLPFQFIGFFMWKKHIKDERFKIVTMRKLSRRSIFIISIIGIAAVVTFGLLLHNLDSWFMNAMKRNASIYTYLDTVFQLPLLGPILDSSTEVLQIIAQLLMIYAFAEQWLMWILTNVITIIMWVVVLIADPSSIPWALPTLIMWMAYLVNSIYGYSNWLRGAKTNV